VAYLIDAVRQFADRTGTADDRMVTVVRFNQVLADPVLEDEVRELRSLRLSRLRHGRDTPRNLLRARQPMNA